ncbi:glycosyl hydrolase family 28-related protein [Roseomonas rosulenta]|uniref:glycosyl hydrolase family 28-related protein n=1 Tax=Roseomonas rosulenta TaxID=2748667 RepID=UPI0018E05AA8|nr:glycosyl hydrolase family 28-related protein [Roseomonas rosulenta]
MSDTKISALPAVAAAADADLLPVVQGSGGGAVTRRASLAQLRSGLLADRPVHVRDFGAVGDGTTNDAPAIQAAVDALAANGGGVLQVGPRAYRIGTPVVVNSAAIVLQGAGFNEGPNAASGTWLTISQTGFTPFTFTGAATRGSVVRDLAVRQTHSATVGPAWTPTNYDFVFRIQDCLGGIDFDNVMLCGINRGIWIDNSGRFNIQRLRGQVYTTGIEIDRSYETGRIQHLHFWPFAQPADDVVRWQQANQDAVVLRRVDGIFMDDLFVFAARSGLRFTSSASGIAQKFYIGSYYSDFTQYGLWVDGNNVAGQIANITTQSELFNAGGAAYAGGQGIRIDGNNARIQIGNLRVDDAESNAIRVNGTGNRLDIFSFRAEFYNTLNDGSAAIHVANVASGTPNAVFLGSPALLGNGNSGPLVNGGTNGYVALSAPAGRVDRPGVMVGSEASGIFAPASTEIAAVTAGVEVFRASSAGNISLGGVNGAHGFGISTPASSVNRVLATSAASGGTPSLAIQGSDANAGIALAAKGTGTVRLQTRGATALEVNATGTPGNFVRVNATAAGGTPQLLAQGTDTNVALQLSAKGAAAVSATNPLQLAGYTVATLPAAASYARSLIFVSDGTANKRLAISDGTNWRWPDGAVVS